MITPKPGDMIDAGSALPPPLVSPTPQTTPTIWGAVQAIGTSAVTYFVATKFGLPADYAVPLAGSVASIATSGLHAWAQRLHLAAPF